MTNTSTLSAHALAELVEIGLGAVPRCGVNPGVAAKLERDGFVETVELPSLFKTHRGRAIQHLKITDAGKARLARIEANG